MAIFLSNILEKKQPFYLLEEKRLRENLSLIKSISDQSGAEFILAFKAFALWKVFPIFKEYINSSTASSLSEAKMAYEKFGSLAHTYSPAYTDYDIKDIAKYSSHITFNSLSQFSMFKDKALSVNKNIKIGVRVNPEYSEIETVLYNPCASGSRFGVLESNLPEQLPKEISGFHCHCLCENGAETFERVLYNIEKRFGKWFNQIEWINFGGGHLVTRKDYNVKLLISIIQRFKSKYPHLHVIFEPGSAFAWQCGNLYANVVDIVENNKIKTALLNVSFTCHMPDCLEMPYNPAITNAIFVDDINSVAENTYRLGGNSCLSGDYMGCWQFNSELNIGDSVVFEDMIHYTTVKTNTFNGVSHPTIALLKLNNDIDILRSFTPDDYINRMD